MNLEGQERSCGSLDEGKQETEVLGFALGLRQTEVMRTPSFYLDHIPQVTSLGKAAAVECRNPSQK